MFRHPDVIEALEARRRAAQLHLFDPNVRLIDVGWRIREREGRIDRGDLRVRVHLRSKPRGAAFESFAAASPERVADESRIGFPVDVVEAAYHLNVPNGSGAPGIGGSPGGAVPPQTWESDPLPRRSIYRPLRGGASGIREAGSAATLGGFVRDRLTGDPMILSNFHVLANAANPGRSVAIVQPSPLDGGWGKAPVARYTRDAMSDSLDAAVATLAPGIAFVNDQVGIGPVTGLGTPDERATVIKSGRTTGVTTGMIDGFEGEGVLMKYGGMPTVIRHVWHIENGGRPTSAGGDSGSWWLDRQTRRVVGLHFAGYHSYGANYALMLTMSKVLDSLRVDLALN